MNSKVVSEYTYSWINMSEGKNSIQFLSSYEWIWWNIRKYSWVNSKYDGMKELLSFYE